MQIEGINSYRRCATLILTTQDNAFPCFSRALTEIFRGAGDIFWCAWAALRLAQVTETSRNQRQCHRLVTQQLLSSLLFLESEKGPARCASDLQDEFEGELDNYAVLEKLQYEGNGRLLFQ